MHPSTPRIETILAQAVEIAMPAERQAFVEKACAGDAEVQRRVEGLVERHFQAGSFLEQPVVDLAAAGPTVSPLSGPAYGPGTVLGPYRLLELLGEGGMGLVYVAEQEQPFRRRVALKLIKPGMDSKQVIARFEAERQALALMDHPHIARVHEGGTTPEGRPYFVMELVRGTSITTYCDQHRLGTRARLRLFQDVCAAVQHAHQKGIIHRDLKPSNVLVSVHDVTPVVKVIDFGVAKALGGRLTDKTLYTAFAQLVGTPLYMSPEQAGLSDLDVDTRSDVYSLGVLLYELLTGTTPFDSETLKQAGYDEMRRIIREDEPPRPSTRLSTIRDLQLSTIAERRGLEPRRLRQQVRGELDWIAMKALEKDRNRRYESASALAADVERYLHDEPVQACGPSRTYRLRKFARRHKVGLSVAAGVLAVLVGGVFFLWRDLGQRAAARATIEAALARADVLREQERWQEASAVLGVAHGQLEGRGLGAQQVGVEQAERDVAMLLLLEDVRLQAVDVKDTGFDDAKTDRLYAQAFQQYGLDVTVRDPEEAARRVRASAIRDRLTEALDDWATCRRRKSDADGVETLRRIARLVDDDPWRRPLRQAVLSADRVSLEALAGEKETPGKRPPALVWLARSLVAVGSRASAERLLRRAQRDHPGDFWVNFELAIFLHVEKRPKNEEALRFCEAALALRPQSPAVLGNLGIILRDQGKLTEAEAAFRKAIELKPDHAGSYDNLAAFLHDQGNLAEAEEACRKALALSPDDGNAYCNLGGTLADLGRVAEAEEADRKAITLQPNSALAHANLGAALFGQRRLAEAEGALRKALALKPDYAEALNNLGSVLVMQGKLAEAGTAFRKVIALQPDCAPALRNLGNLLCSQGKLVEAETAFRQAIALMPDSAKGYADLGRVLGRRGDYNGLLGGFREVVRLKPNSSEAHNNLAWLLATCPNAEFRDPGQAVRHARKAVELAPGNAGAWNTLGVAQYRNGDWQAAIEALFKSVQSGKGGDSTDFFFLAMTHWQLHEKENARAWYDRAIAWMDQHNPHDAELIRFRAEATALLGPAEPPPPR